MKKSKNSGVNSANLMKFLIYLIFFSGILHLSRKRRRSKKKGTFCTEDSVQFNTKCN